MLPKCCYNVACNIRHFISKTPFRTSSANDSKLNVVGLLNHNAKPDEPHNHTPHETKQTKTRTSERTTQRTRFMGVVMLSIDRYTYPSVAIWLKREQTAQGRLCKTLHNSSQSIILQLPCKILS